MKNILLITLMICCEFFTAEMLAQKWLIVGRNKDNQDGFSIVCNQAVTPADVVYVTEEEYSCGLDQFTANTELVAKYVPPVGGHAAGEVISFEESSTTSNLIVLVGCSSGTCGTITSTGTFAIGTSNDALYAYSDTDDNPANGVTEIYCAWFWNGSEGAGGEDPVCDYANSKKLTIAGNISKVDYTPALRTADLTATSYQSIASYTQSGSNSALSTVAFSAGLLPVQLTDFRVIKKNREVALNWVTASELNNKYFTIQRSADGVEFESIGRIDGMGTTFESTNYEFMDDSPLSGLNYYRLKQVDFDDKFSFSPIVAVDFNEVRPTTFGVSPNPFSNEVSIDFPEAFNRDIDIKVYDLFGRLVAADLLEKEQTTKNLNLENLDSGIYIIQVGEGTSSYTQRITKF